MLGDGTNNSLTSKVGNLKQNAQKLSSMMAAVGAKTLKNIEYVMDQKPSQGPLRCELPSFANDANSAWCSVLTRKRSEKASHVQLRPVAQARRSKLQLRVRVGSQTISPLYWALRSGAVYRFSKQIEDDRGTIFPIGSCFQDRICSGKLQKQSKTIRPACRLVKTRRVKKLIDYVTWIPLHLAQAEVGGFKADGQADRSICITLKTGTSRWKANRVNLSRWF